MNLRVRSQTGDALRAGCGVYRSIPVVVAAVLLQGCAAAGLTLLGVGVDVGADAGVTYTLDGISDRTFTDAAERVRQATLTALDEGRLARRRLNPSRVLTGPIVGYSPIDPTPLTCE